MTFPFLPNWIVFGSPQWTWPVAIIAAILAALVIWNYARQSAPGWARLLAASLKLIAIALLAICILQPMVKATRARPQANLLPTLIDTSRSMGLKLPSNDQSRGESFVEALDPSAPWRVRVGQDFDVRDYQYASRLDQLPDVDSLAFDGESSALKESLRILSQRFDSRPVAGLVLMTDGNATDTDIDELSDIDWSTLGFPVYPVLLDENDQLDDLRVAGVSIRQTNFESAPITISVRGQCSGDAPPTIQAKLIDAESDNVVAQQSVALDPKSKKLDFRFQFRPTQNGVAFYKVCLFTNDDRELFVSSKLSTDSEKPPQSSWEPTLENNQRLLAIERKQGPYRVLYVAGRPNWDFKFLRRSLQSDSEVQLVGLLRIADKEPKFTFRDSSLNETNPLFAGLGEDEEEAAEQYDESVILRLGVKASEELSDGFPETAEELFAYHAVILDDIETDFFTADQLLLLRQFVAARGGGLLMLGGQEMFGKRDFQTTPLGELSPVYGPKDFASIRSNETALGASPRRLDLTREGLLQPWLRLRDDQNSEAKRLTEMPTFTTVNPVGAIKPGATKLMTLTNLDGEESPALITQRFGKGKSAAVPVGDLWRWAMRRDRESNDDPAQAWRQLVRWLVGDVPRRLEVTNQQPTIPTDPVKLTVRVRDENYLPLDNANVSVFVTRSSANDDSSDPIELSASPSVDESGIYVTEHFANQPGGYRATVLVTADDGTPVGETETGWTMDPAASEFRDLAINRKLLEQIAEQSGGEVIPIGKLSAFAADLPNRKLPVVDTWIYPLWHTPWAMLIAIGCLCGEWTLRRWKGMA